MRSELRVLVRLAEFALDEAKAGLLDRRQRAAEIDVRLEELDGELVREGEVARADPVIAGESYRHFVRIAADRQRSLREAQAAAEVEVAVARDALAEAHRRLRSLELAQAARDRRHAAQAARAEQVRLDDLARDLHRFLAS